MKTDNNETSRGTKRPRPIPGEQDVIWECGNQMGGGGGGNEGGGGGGETYARLVGVRGWQLREGRGLMVPDFGGSAVDVEEDRLPESLRANDLDEEEVQWWVLACIQCCGPIDPDTAGGPVNLGEVVRFGVTEVMSDRRPEVTAEQAQALAQGLAENILWDVGYCFEPVDEQAKEMGHE